MFEQYIDEQSVAVKTLINALKKNRLSHAYIFETNNYLDAYNMITDFVKYILCDESRNPKHDEASCNICSSINDNNYIEYKVINSTTLQIKKEEITSLQDEFKTKAIEGKRRIYLIKNAEKLNNSSANTILKFLEEPEENIIAILVTPSQYLLFDTIISRCQIISLVNKQKESDIVENLYQDIYFEESLTEELKIKIQTDIDNALSFIKCIETKGKDTILFSNEYFFKYFNDRESCLKAFEIVKLIYYDMLKYKTNHKYRYFTLKEDELNKIVENNTINTLASKLNIIIKTIDKIKYNVNLNLLVDKFLMEMGGSINDRCS